MQNLKADADRSRALLHQLLPASIADDLKADKISSYKIMTMLLLCKCYDNVT